MNQSPVTLGSWLFIGTDTSIINVDTNSGFNDGNYSGIKAKYRLYNPEYILTGGMGLGFLKFEDAARIGSLNLDLSAHYRHNSRLSYGPELLTFLGSGDRMGSSSKLITSYLGAGIARDFDFRDNTLTVGAKALMDVNIPNKTSTMFQLYVEIGFGMKARDPIVAAACIEQKPTVALQLPEDKAPEVKIEREDKIIARAAAPVKPNFPTNSDPNDGQRLPAIMVLNFDMASDQIVADDQRRLNQLIQVLMRHSSQFESVEVVGHSDKTGPEALNEKLSLKRAKYVADFMKEAGLRSHKEVVGMGSKIPVDAATLNPNRRVEIRLRGIKDKLALEKALSKIN